MNTKPCPRCGRPVERGPRARFCSETCRVRLWQERRLAASASHMTEPSAMQRGVPQRAVITGPRAILWAILGQLVELETQLPSRPDITRAVGRALLAVDALRELVPRRVRTTQDRGMASRKTREKRGNCDRQRSSDRSDRSPFQGQ